jgi:hypothetical protein
VATLGSNQETDSTVSNFAFFKDVVLKKNGRNLKIIEKLSVLQNWGREGHWVL